MVATAGRHWNMIGTCDGFFLHLHVLCASHVCDVSHSAGVQCVCENLPTSRKTELVELKTWYQAPPPAIEKSHHVAQLRALIFQTRVILQVTHLFAGQRVYLKSVPCLRDDNKRVRCSVKPIAYGRHAIHKIQFASYIPRERGAHVLVYANL